MIEDLRNEQIETLEAAPIAYFYCARNAAEPEWSNPEEALRSILEQLSSNTSDLPVRKPVDVYKEKTRENWGMTPNDPLSLDETVEVLLGVLKENLPINIIDALDECDPEEIHIYCPH